jgi:hypothetical protein
MSGRLSKVVDVTIVYPQGVPTFWEFLQGKCREVHIDIRQLALPDLAEAEDEVQRKAALAQWMRNVWLEKDQLIGKLRSA